MNRFVLAFVFVGLCGATPIIPPTPYLFAPIEITGGAYYEEFPPSGPYEAWQGNLSLQSVIPNELLVTAEDGGGSHPCCWPGPTAVQYWSSYGENGAMFSLNVNVPDTAPSFYACNGCENGYNGFTFDFSPAADGTFTGELDVVEQDDAGDRTTVAIIPVYGDYTFGPDGEYGQSAAYEFFAAPEPNTTYLSLGAFAALYLLRRRKAARVNSHLQL